MEQKHNMEEKKIITTKTSQALRDRMEKISAEILKRNEKLYKRLENR